MTVQSPRVVIPAAPAYNEPALLAHGLRRGMWVTDGAFPRAAILMELDARGQALVMRVDAAGLNEAPLQIPANQLRQAFLDEIPEARFTRPKAEFEAMGYRRRQ